MRVTQASEQTQFLSALNTLESNISQTQNDVSSGLAYTTPAQDPSAAGTVDNYDAALAQSQQYTANANSAQTALNTEGTALSQVTTQLQSLRDLALQANSGTESTQDLSAIATQAQQIQNSLLSLANTQDGNGNYIFAGFASQTQPFVATATGATYAGDQGQSKMQIAAGQTVDTGDNGEAVFFSPTGNGTFNVSPTATNTGTGVVGATSVATTYNGNDYSINFTGANTYQVQDTTTNTSVASGTYTAGGAISFGGLEVTLSGAPASGDSFQVAPSSNQNIFATVQNLVTALQTAGSSPAAQTQLSNSINTAINNISQALTQTSTVQAAVGGRLNAITTQLSVATSQQTQLTQSISSLQGLNYASAYTTLEAQNTTLSAAMQAYTLTQGLTLFKYIS
jgi:flagellar hook-associated protein 3 FlgL